MSDLPRDFVPCRWCNGIGCISCFNARKAKEKELDEEYKHQFPDGPKPMFTAHLDNPEEMATLKEVFGREALEKAFGADGRGMEEVVENLAKAKERGNP